MVFVLLQSSGIYFVVIKWYLFCSNQVAFTPTQVEAITAGMRLGLTMVVNGYNISKYFNTKLDYAFILLLTSITFSSLAYSKNALLISINVFQKCSGNFMNHRDDLL